MTSKSPQGWADNVLPAWWRRDFLRTELIVAMAGTMAFVGWVHFLKGNNVINSVLLGSRSAIYGTLASISGSLLGFTITAVSIVFGLIHLDRLSLVRKSAHYQDLWKTFTSAIRALAFATVATLGGLLLDRDKSPAYVIVHLCVFGTLLASLRLARCVWVLEKIIAVVTAPPRDTPPLSETPLH